MDQEANRIRKENSYNFYSSKLIDKKTIRQATKKGDRYLAEDLTQEEATPEGKTEFTIEVQREAFEIKTQGAEHDASVNTQIQDSILRVLALCTNELNKSYPLQ